MQSAWRKLIFIACTFAIVCYVALYKTTRTFRMDKLGHDGPSFKCVRNCHLISPGGKEPKELTLNQITRIAGMRTYNLLGEGGKDAEPGSEEVLGASQEEVTAYNNFAGSEPGQHAKKEDATVQVESGGSSDEGEKEKEEESKEEQTQAKISEEKEIDEESKEEQTKAQISKETGVDEETKGQAGVQSEEQASEEKTDNESKPSGEKDKEEEEEEEKEGDSKELGIEGVGESQNKGRYSIITSPWILRREWIYQQWRTPAVQKNVKYVIQYMENHLGRDHFSSCPYNKCEMTEDFTKADLVVFNGWLLTRTPIEKFWKRPPTQRWIFKTVDPVISGFGLHNDSIKHMFNWTATYKINSDIPSVMGMLSRKPNYVPKDYSKIWKQKTKLAAWFVSHCNTWSKREEYAARMATVAPVDIFGRCGPFDCGQNHGRMKYDIPECFPILSENYKFYLSFENSFCHDYVTEKLFKVFLDVQIIPVVRGGVDYNSAFPKGSFVNTDDFDSPEDLMRYLVKLGNDEEAYSKMLAEKDKWAWVSLPEANFFCKACEKLHTDTSVHHYEDISKALQTDEEECWPPRDLGDKYKNYDMDMIIASES